MKSCILIAMVVLLGSCAAQPPALPVSHGIQSAGNANAGLAADLDNTGKSIDAAKQTAGAVANAHLADATSSNDDAKSKAVVTAQALGEANDQVADLEKQLVKSKQETIDAKKDGDARVSKAVEDGHAPVVRAFWGISVLAFLGGIACWIAYEQTSMVWLERTAIIAAVTCGAAIGVSIFITMSVSVAAMVTPVFAWCIAAIVITCTVVAVVIIAYEASTRGKTIVEKWLNSKGITTLTPSAAKVMKNMIDSTTVLKPAAVESVSSAAG